MIFINFGLKKISENIYENKITFEKFVEILEYYKNKNFKIQEENYYLIKYLNYECKKYQDKIKINKITTIDILELEYNLISLDKIEEISEEYFPVLNKYIYEKQVFDTIIDLDLETKLIFRTDNILYEILLVNNKDMKILDKENIKNIIQEINNLL